MPDLPHASQPNIIWFCADQMRFDTIAGLGNKQISTPNIDRLLKRGTAFENCYAQNQVCTPSRASFLTGRYPAAHQVYRNNNAYFPPSEKLVTRTLADAGYDCGLIGKLHLSTATRLEARNDDGYRVYEWCQNPGWERVVGSNAYWNWLREKGETPEKMFAGKPPYLSTGVPEELHQAAWMAERAIAFINEPRKGPWLLSLNPFDPHPPFDPPEALFRKYADRDLDPPLFRSSDIDHQRRFHNVRNQMREAVNPVLGEAERAEYAPKPGDPLGAKPPRRFDGMAVKAAYYAMIENLDRALGRIIDHLEACGLMDKTIVIFTSDHGEMLGDHGLLYKGCRFFEGLVHVPLIVSGPGIAAGQRRRAMVETVDIAPTLLDFAGINQDHDMQGLSLRRILSTGPDDHKETAVTDFNDSVATSETKTYTQASMTCDGRYKLAVYHSHPGLGELFDLLEDPHEFHCRWNDPDYQSLKCELLARHMDRMMGTISAGPERAPLPDG